MFGSMRVSASCFRLSLLLALALAGRAVPAAAQCPASDVNCEGDVTSTAAASYSAGCSIDGITGFDVPLATLDVAIPPFGYSLLYADHAEVILRDLFTFHGPADGTPYTIHLRVRARGDAYSPGGPGDSDGTILSLSATTPQAGDPSASRGWGTFAGSYSYDDSLDLVLTRLGGPPVGITLDASSVGSNGLATGHFDFRFVDLPPGWSVTSCKGYREEQPVPTRVASWGRVKAAYR
jgi:hypothetical protein